MLSEMKTLRLWSLIFWVHVTSVLGDGGDAVPVGNFEEFRIPEQKETDAWSYRRQRRPISSSSNYNEFLAASSDGVITRREMESFVSATPAPENVNCHVEVEITETRMLGGECIRLGSSSNFRACRSGPYLDLFSRQCNTILGRGGGRGGGRAPANGNSGAGAGQSDTGGTTQQTT